MRKILLILLICISVYSQEQNKISLKVEIDKTKPVKNIPIKFLIKNISKKNVNIDNFELYQYAIFNDDNEGIGIPHTQTTFSLNVKNKLIKPNETFIKVFEFRDSFLLDKRFEKIKDSKKDFYFRCMVSYLDKSYECNKLKLKIN